ncbi:MAG TPA: hypothetical protein VGO93_09315 [Candidatus Xenobia bacterium]
MVLFVVVLYVDLCDKRPIEARLACRAWWWRWAAYYVLMVGALLYDRFDTITLAFCHF